MDTNVSLAYLASISGLYKAVGYFGDTFSTQIVVRPYEFTLDVKAFTTKDGQVIHYGDKQGSWYPIDTYKDTIEDEEQLKFFEKAVMPAARMHKVYHEDMYSGLREYREKVTIPQAKKYGNVHYGFGLYINCPKKLTSSTIRSLNNGVAQSHSFLSILAMERFRRLRDRRGISSKDIQLIATVYDSIYLLVKDDKKLIDFVNKELIAYMQEDCLEVMPVKLSADLEISRDSWANFEVYEG